MSKRYITLDWSDFAIKNNSRHSGNSYTTLDRRDVVLRVLDHWSKARPGAGETGLDRKILIRIPPDGFYCPPRAKLVEGMVVKAEVKLRQDGEDPTLETYVEEDEAQRCNALVIVPAKYVDVVCYSREALLENNGKSSTGCDFEIVCLLASVGDNEPMMPMAMARNYLEMPGGTKSDYTAREFAEAVYYWGSQRGVRVRLKEDTSWR